MFWKLCVTVCLAFAGDPSKDERADKPSKKDDEVVAVMDSKEIHHSDIEPDEKALARVKPDDREKTIKRWRASNLHGFILTPLVQEYANKHKIKATDEEVESFNEHMDKAVRKAAAENPDEEFLDLNRDDKEALAAKREIGRAMVETWKVSKELYSQYGGEVIFQQANPTEPVGAYRKLLEEAEKKGRFQIIDPEVRKDFWAYFSPRGHSVLPKEMAEKIFKKPWWEQKPTDLLGNQPNSAPDATERR